jgi:uncharacterized membrane protein
MGAMESITQQQAVGWDGLDGRRERVAFWRARHLDGLDGLAARFTTHRYAPHTHETWVMGVVTAGCEVFACRGARHRAAPGQVCVVPPGEVHDGEPEAEGYEYRMLYPSPRLVDGLARELAERPGRGTPSFAGSVLDDPELAALFVAAHEHLGEAPDDLAGEELLCAAVAALLGRHARLNAPSSAALTSGRRERDAVARARSDIEARYAEPLSLADLACPGRPDPLPPDPRLQARVRHHPAPLPGRPPRPRSPCPPARRPPAGRGGAARRLQRPEPPHPRLQGPPRRHARRLPARRPVTRVTGTPFRDGLVDVAPVLVGLVPFALVLGALAAGKGLSPLEVMLMSALVFAGGSQFVAVELWRDPVPVGALALMALLVNVRHLLMGASLAPRAHDWGGRAWPALFFMADEVWALALRRAGDDGPVPLGYWLGLSTGLWLNWVALTGVGAWLGAVGRGPDQPRVRLRVRGRVRGPAARDVARPDDAAAVGRERDHGGARPPRRARSLVRCGRRPGRASDGGAHGAPRGAGCVSLDPATVAAIFAMAVVTYATRVAGFALVRRLELTGRARLALEAVPGAVLVALVAPAVLTSGPADAMAGLLTVLAALRLPVLGVVAVGVVSAGVLRAVLG